MSEFSTEISSPFFTENRTPSIVIRRCNTVFNPYRYIKCPYCISPSAVIQLSDTNNLCESCHQFFPSKRILLPYGGNFVMTRISFNENLLCYNERGLRISHSLSMSRNPHPPEELHIDIVESQTQNCHSRVVVPVVGPSFLANEVLLGITAQAAMSLLGICIGGKSFPPALYYVMGANAVGFVGSLAAMLLREKKRRAAGVLAKVGAVGAASGTIVALGMFLPVNFIWTAGLAFVVSAIAVSLS